MQDLEGPGGQAFLTRSELELQLARLALVVMRAAPDAFADFGGIAPKADPLEASPADLAAELLRNARPEHRAFAEARLLELSRCMAGIRHPAGTHDWLSVTLDVPGPGSSAPVAASAAGERRTG